jgi:hypothetical protein
VPSYATVSARWTASELVARICRRGADLDARAGPTLAVVPFEDLPVAEFAFPGPLRDQLVAAILASSKTTTTGLVADYQHEGEPLPHPGLRQASRSDAIPWRRFVEFGQGHH